MIPVTLPIAIRTHLQIWKMISIGYRRWDRKRSFTGKFYANLRRETHVSWSRWPMNVRKQHSFKDLVIMMIHLISLSPSLFFSGTGRTEEIRFHHGTHTSGWNQFQFHDARITGVHHFGRQNCQSERPFSGWSHSRSTIFTAITITTSVQNCAHAQSRWSNYWQLPMFTDREGHEP